MGIITIPTYGTDPATVNAANLDAKVSGLATEFNGNIDNDNIKSSAAIANSKLNLATISQAVTHTGTLSMTSKDFSEAKGADIASAATTTIWVTDGNFIHITGTTTITSFGTADQAGDERTIVFDGALTLTHNATSLILPGGANLTTAAGDRAIVRAETTTNARVISYTKADGKAIVDYTPSASNALAGSVIQVVNTQTGAVGTTTAVTTPAVDDTIPQSSEGVEVMTLAATPNNSNNKLKIDVVVTGSLSSTRELVVALFQDSTANALACCSEHVTTDEIETIKFTHYMDAGTASSTTFKVRVGSASGNFTLNGIATNTRRYGGVLASSITITEIKV